MRNAISLTVMIGALLVLVFSATGCQPDQGIDTRAASRVIAPR